MTGSYAVREGHIVAVAGVTRDQIRRSCMEVFPSFEDAFEYVVVLFTTTGFGRMTTWPEFDDSILMAAIVRGVEEEGGASICIANPYGDELAFSQLFAVDMRYFREGKPVEHLINYIMDRHRRSG